MTVDDQNPSRSTSRSRLVSENAPCSLTGQIRYSSPACGDERGESKNLLHANADSLWAGPRAEVLFHGSR
jgi:hypothetical protein